MFRNPKGQDVGHISGESYITSRDARKGQIYLLKHYFNGKYIELPIGIQRSILDRLRDSKVIKYIDVIILGIEERSYMTRTLIEDIYKEGVLVKEDKGRSGDMVLWGYQYIWDVFNKKIDL